VGFFTKNPSLTFLPILLLIPLSAANAGIFSFLGELFLGGHTEVFERELNSQNIALLQGAVNSDPNPSKGGGDITIVGDSALLPETGPIGTLADIDETSTQKSDRISVYVVREGDSLSQIAKMFGVDANTIRWANDIGRGDVIKEGQTLIILPVSGVRYTVEKGDTLASIIKELGGDMDEVINYNGLEDGATLAIGDVITIPGGEMQAPAQTTTSTYTAPRRSSGPNYDGYYIWPVDGGRITQGIHGYNGVDVGAPYGTSVFAAAGGEVIISRYSSGNPWFGGYGNYIVVEHANGTQTLYSHLSNVIVKRGWNVVQGQVIGYIGSTGRSTGPHLHFEVRGAKNPLVN